MIDIVEDNDPDSEAERLTALLGVMLSPLISSPSLLTSSMRASPSRGSRRSFPGLAGTPFHRLAG